MSNVKKIKPPKITPDIKVAVDIFKQMMPKWEGTVMLFHTEYGNVIVTGDVIYKHIHKAVKAAMKAHGKKTGKR